MPPQSEEDEMNTDRNTIRLLGGAFLLVFLTSTISNFLLTSAIGSGSISEILASIPGNLALMRISILVELLTSVGIVALAALLYVIFRKQYRVIATVAFGWWLAEGIILGLSKLGAYALIPLSMNFQAAGAPASSFHQTLGEFLYQGLDRQGWSLHMLFFCLGGILWYYLFVRSRAIPRVLSIWGLAAICLLTINVLWGLYDPALGVVIYLGAPYMLFEFLIGPWLMVRGIEKGSEISE
jgi:hypothetical protein